MKGSMGEIRDAGERALEIATQIAELLNEMDEVDPGRTTIAAGRIVGPGVEVRRIADRFTARS